MLLSSALIGTTSTSAATEAGTIPGTFQVNDTGAATYTVPLKLPPGTAGLQPNLSLVYNSQSGNGLLGVGWSLSGLSAISRCPQTVAQDGTKGGINYDSNDRYCLDGQRLVVVNGAYGADGTEYRTERESFAKIISYSSAGNGPAWFKVWTKAGQIMEYGNTADSRIEAQGKPTVRVWALNKVQDTKGNYFTVSYTEDGANGDYYPSRIDYTGNGNTGLQPNNSVQFTYETRPDVTPAYHAGSLIRNTVRLTHVKAFSGATMVRDLILAFDISAGTSRSRLVDLKECAEGGVCQPALSLGWQNTDNSFGWDSGPIWGSNGNANDSARYQTGDFNGDGKTDVLFVSDGSYYARLSTGSSFGWEPGPVWGANGNNYTDPARYQTGDFNGDGKTDVIFISDGSYYVRLSTGSSFGWEPGPVWGTKGNGNTALSRFRVGDFNGDGKTDVLFVSPVDGSYYVRLSTGSSFGWNSGPIWGGNGNSNTDPARYKIGDFNGDGKTDILFIDPNDGSYRVRLSTGTGFMPDAIWGANGNGYTDPARYQTGDFNGDGKTDVLFVSPADGSYYVRLSTGSSFGWDSGPIWGANGNGYTPPSLYRVGDFNGDGKMDVLFISPVNGAYYVRQSSGAFPDFLTSITPGLGATATITYKPLTDGTGYAKDTTATYPLLDLQVPLYVVASATSSNGVGGTTTTHYTYGGAKVDLSGRGFLGYRWKQSTQVETGLTTRTDYRQDWPYVGLPSQTKKTHPAAAGPNNQLSLVTHTYDCLTPQTGVACTIVPGNRYFPYVAQSVESSWDLNGAAIPPVTTANQFDSYGNTTQITVSTGDGYSKTTTNTYNNDAGNWFLGRLQRSSVTSVTSVTP